MTRKTRGFTLFELAVTILIIFFLVSAGTLATSEVADAKRYRAVKDALALYNEQFGTRDHNGFVGDVGRLTPPAATFTEACAAKPNGLATQWDNGNLRDVTIGWSGPYIGYMPRQLVQDPWGNDWRIANTPLSDSGRVTSPGPDGILGNGDDINVPELGTATLQAASNQGTAAIVVMDPTTGNPVTGATDLDVQVSNPNGTGGIAWTPLWPAAGAATAPTTPDIHWLVDRLATGRHAVKATARAGGNLPPGAAAYGSFWVASGKQVRVELRLRY